MIQSSAQFSMFSMDTYYMLNNIWVYGNLCLIMPFFIAGFNRYHNQAKDIELNTDHLSRGALIFTCLFYCIDTPVKYTIDGIDSVCEKAFFLHHLSALLVIVPICVNRYIPWWVNILGFLHGIMLYWPHIEWINYVYVLSMIYFHYNLYRKEYRELRLYGVARFSTNYMYVFMIMALLGKCNNYLPLGP